MLALKYLLMFLGAALFGSAGALVAYDIFLSAQLRWLLRRNTADTSGAEVGACVSRSARRIDFIYKMNFLGGNVGQGLR
jgi:hypothetical protein